MGKVLFTHSCFDCIAETPFSKNGGVRTSVNLLLHKSSENTGKNGQNKLCWNSGNEPEIDIISGRFIQEKLLNLQLDLLSFSSPMICGSIESHQPCSHGNCENQQPCSHWKGQMRFEAPQKSSSQSVVTL